MNSGDISDLALIVEDDRQQRAATVLVDVAYVIRAHFELTAKAGPDDNEGKHLDSFNRRARKGQCFHQPCLGTREFPAKFRLIDPDESPPLTIGETRDLVHRHIHKIQGPPSLGQADHRNRRGFIVGLINGSEPPLYLLSESVH
jgi:CRISPR-associated protein (Cas_Cas5)